MSSREELIKHPQVEAILIATPNHIHEEDALACAACVKPALCEKPLAPTMPAIIYRNNLKNREFGKEAPQNFQARALQSERPLPSRQGASEHENCEKKPTWPKTDSSGCFGMNMINAFQKHSVPLFVGQSLRFKFCVQTAKQLLESGRLGQLLSIRAHFSVPVPKDNRRYQKAHGGEVLADIRVHLIDLIRFISGEEIQSISPLANHDYQSNAPEADEKAGMPA